MDPKSEWALGEFRDAAIELRLLERKSASSGAKRGQGGGGGGDTGSQEQASSICSAAGGRRRAVSIRSAHQGERLAGLLVVKIEAGAGGGEQRSRWRQFGRELNVELEITTEAAALAGTPFVSEEPSLWRDYEGRENARDRSVLARSNRTVSLSPINDSLSAIESATGELVYALDVEVQVPVEFLGQNVALDALVSPARGGQGQGGDASAAAATSPSAAAGKGGDGGGGGGGGGRRRGVGGDFANRLDSLFALSRVAPVRLPVRRCFVPLRVVQPITVTSRSCPPSPSPIAAPGGSGAFAGAIGRCLVALEIRNDHPVAAVTVHDVEVHVDATARCGERASSKGFSAPGKAGGGGEGGGRGRRGKGHGRMSGGVSLEVCFVCVRVLGGLDGSIEQPPLAGRGGLGGSGAPATGSFSRVFCSSWVVKPPLPLELAPGEVQGFVLSISPAGEPLPPRRAGGQFESPVTFVWTLDAGDGNGADAGGSSTTTPVGGKKTGTAAAVAAAAAAAAAVASAAAKRNFDSSPSSRRSTSRSPSPPPPPSRFARHKSPPATTTSVHLAQWQSEQRARDEVLVRVKGQPRVKLNHVFEVFLRVRNLSDSARDLVVMFTEDPGDGRQRRGGNSGGGRRRLSLERSTVRGMRSKSDSGGGGGGGADGFGSDTDSDDAEPVVARDISPSGSPGYHGRGVSFTAGGGRGRAGRGGPPGFPGPRSSPPRAPPPPPPPPPPKSAAATAAAAAAAAVLASAAASSSAAAPTSLLGDLVPVDAAVPLGRLERGAEHGATVRLTAARAGLARLSTLCLRDSLTGSVYVPACPYEVFVES
ncbi:unnamed protein product [Pylaiella littoralis]